MGRSAGGDDRHRGGLTRLFAGLLFVALVATGVRVHLLRLFLPPHHPQHRFSAPGGGVSREPLHWSPDPTPVELQRFLAEVRARTKAGEKLAFIAPPPYGDFSYFYWRASYAWTGRWMLLPGTVFDPYEADLVAVWGQPHEDPRWKPVWSGHGGTLARRVDL